MPHARNTQVVIGMLIVTLALPLAADVLLKEGSDVDVSSALIDVRDAEVMRRDTARALEDRVRERGKQRQFWQAMREYQTRARTEEGLTPPDVNDYASILFYLKQTDKEVMNSDRVHAAAEDNEEEAEELVEEKKASSLTVKDLGEKDRLLLRRYTKARSCPESLKNYGLEGFYELCLSVTDTPGEEPRRGLLNLNEWLRGRMAAPNSEIPAWKLRMKMLEEALDRSNRRESTQPGRPTSYLKQD